MDMDKLVALCRRRGFIFQSSEIYGGINGFWDYGPLGVELKKNIKDVWWQDMVRNPPPGPDGQEIQMVGVDCALIMNPKVWVASGHVGGFQDPMQTCRQCKKLYRADQVWEMLRESAWVKALASAFTDVSDPNLIAVSGPALLKWANGKGRKVAPGLALVRNPSVTLSWLVEYLEKNPAKGIDIITLLRYLATEQIAQTGLVNPCPNCDLTEPRQFNLMFETYVGVVRDEESKAYLRPETAQGIFVNFRNVLDSTRLKLPFGIAQVGKAFRNEINPRNYTFRSREFEQMEIEFFCHPAESMKWYQYWRELRIRWYSQLGIQSDRLRPREQGKEELAHYSIGTTDIEYLFPFASEPQELEGVAHRGNYDLKQHMTHSGKELTYFDEDAWARDINTRGTSSFREWLKTTPSPAAVEQYQFIPHVIEPSAGADRATLAFLCEAYQEDRVPDEHGQPTERVFLKLHPRLAPIKAAVFPLVKKDGMPEIAQQIYRSVKKHYNVFYDDKGAVGRRYRRQDEAGTPFCITVDGQTLQDQTVTIRDRDTLKQWRVKVEEVTGELHRLLQPGT
jgi:glycyl-tRNA synthetase